MPDLAVVILAAGKGVRMKSDLPKVFHELAGKPMVQHVVETVKALSPRKIVLVVGHKKDLIIDHFKGWPIVFVEQKEQLGTGHAVQQAQAELKDFDGNVLILAGDVPLISESTIKSLIAFHDKNKAAATDLTAELPDAGNYGRIVRNKKGEIERIVEKKDAHEKELKIREINTGLFCFNAKDLFTALKEIKSDNAQKEHYLTDTIEILRKKGRPVFAFLAPDYKETLGVNTPEQLKELEDVYLQNI